MRKTFLLLIFLFSGTAASSPYTDLVYQKSEDTNSALRFINAPEEKIEALRTLVRGKLADNDLVEFANNIIEARETRNVELFKNYVNQESLEFSKDMLNRMIDGISDGSLIYGNSGYKYFVASMPISDRVLEKFYSSNINKPTVALIFYHYHPSNGALIGSPTYLIKTESTLQIVLPVKSVKSRHNNAPKPTQ